MGVGGVRPDGGSLFQDLQGLAGAPFPGKVLDALLPGLHQGPAVRPGEQVLCEESSVEFRLKVRDGDDAGVRVAESRMTSDSRVRSYAITDTWQNNCGRYIKLRVLSVLRQSQITEEAQ